MGAGNGTVMRCTPIGLAAPGLEEARAAAEDARLTHAHPGPRPRLGGDLCRPDRPGRELEPVALGERPDPAPGYRLGAVAVAEQSAGRGRVRVGVAPSKLTQPTPASLAGDGV